MCSCDEKQILDTIPEELMGTLQKIKLDLPFKRFFDAHSTAAECIECIMKAERAEALGLSSDITEYYRKKADLENEVTKRLLSGASKALKELLESREWIEETQKIDSALNDLGIRSVKKEHRARVVDALLESNISGPDAKETLAIWDEGMSALSGEGISGVVSWLNTETRRYIDNLAYPEYGRQPSSPLTSAQRNCIIEATALYLSLLAACAWVPFCWCCYGTWLHHYIYMPALTRCLLK